MKCRPLAKSVLVGVGHPSIRDPILATIITAAETKSLGLLQY